MTIAHRPGRMLTIGVPLLVMTICSIIALSPLFARHPDQLSLGITLDLAVTAPLLYWLVIRRSKIPVSTVARVFVVGLLLAGVLLRNKPHPLLSGLKTWLYPFIEAGILFILIRKFYQARRTAGKQLAAQGHVSSVDFIAHGRTILASMLGSQRLGDVVISEIAVFYYVFLGRRARTVDYRSVFSYHKGNSILLVLGVILCCFIVETAGVHFLIALWSWKAAWVMTVLGGYTTLQLYAHMRAVKARPIFLDGAFLHIRNGLVADVSVALAGIDEVVFVKRNEKKAEAGKAVNLTLLKGLESHNIRIRLKEPVTVYRPFGIRQQTDMLLFFVDRPEEFVASVHALSGAINRS